MKILEIKVLRGPNYWSCTRTNLIQMKLDLEYYENLPTNKLDGFAERLASLVPSLYNHHCSEGVPGGFLSRMKEGTWLGHVIEHVALELQTLAGMDCGFGRTRSTDITGVYYVVFSYQIENAGRYAAEAAVRLAGALAAGDNYNVKPDIDELSRIYYAEKLGPSTQAIVDEAQKRDIPFKRLDDDSLIMLGQGKNQRIICAAMADSTSSIGVELAQNKQVVKKMLEEAFIPVPEGTIIKNEAELTETISRLGYPLALKPVDGNHGRGITTNVTTREQALDALILAKRISEEVIVERFIKGNDYRLLLINYKLAAVSKRTPACVTGDGTSTIKQLIDLENQHPSRGEGHEKPLTFIKVDENTQAILIENKLTLSSILPQGQVLFLKDTANLSSGGTAEDVTHLVHPYTIFLAERTARLMNLDVCGIDVIAKDISLPLTAENGAVLEVNAAPGLRMHQYPFKGEARNVAAAMLDMLYPPGREARIPIAAVTGTNGKTTTVRLLAHLAMAAGRSTGCTTTEGIYLNNNIISYGDCSGPASASVVLRDPLVDYAVLECARGGILRSGLGFDKCNISIVTNISEDHLGLDGINSLEQLVRVKSVVPESTSCDGYAVLNADDDLVYGMIENLSCTIALFSLDAANERIQRHCAAGGLAATVENGWLIVMHGAAKTHIAEIKKIPLTLDGKSDCMVQNAMAAVLGAVISGFPIHTIKEAVKSFKLNPECNPGRMNFYHFNQFDVILDYAHNTVGFNELRKFMSKENASVKVGIIGVAGDRRDEDIINMGMMAAEMFDELIIRHDKDGRGRTKEEITSLLLDGIRKTNPFKPVQIISDEIEALQHAMKNAVPGSLIFLSGEDVHALIDFLSKAETTENTALIKYGS